MNGLARTLVGPQRFIWALFVFPFPFLRNRRFKSPTKRDADTQNFRRLSNMDAPIRAQTGHFAHRHFSGALDRSLIEGTCTLGVMCLVANSGHWNNWPWWIANKRERNQQRPRLAWRARFNSCKVVHKTQLEKQQLWVCQRVRTSNKLRLVPSKKVCARKG